MRGRLEKLDRGTRPGAAVRLLHMPRRWVAAYCGQREASFVSGLGNPRPRPPFAALLQERFVQVTPGALVLSPPYISKSVYKNRRVTRGQHRQMPDEFTETTRCPNRRAVRTDAMSCGGAELGGGCYRSGRRWKSERNDVLTESGILKCHSHLPSPFSFPHPPRTPGPPCATIPT